MYQVILVSAVNVALFETARQTCFLGSIGLAQSNSSYEPKLFLGFHKTAHAAAIKEFIL